MSAQIESIEFSGSGGFILPEVKIFPALVVNISSRIKTVMLPSLILHHMWSHQIFEEYAKKDKGAFPN